MTKLLLDLDKLDFNILKSIVENAFSYSGSVTDRVVQNKMSDKRPYYPFNIIDIRLGILVE